MSNPRKRPPMSEDMTVRDSLESNENPTATIRQKVKDVLRVQARSVSFEQVAKALNHSAVRSYDQDDLNIFLECHGLTDTPHVLMATHSMGDRDWKLEEGSKPPFFADEGFDGGWYAIREKDARYLECGSATSSSSVRAEKTQEDQWKLTLEVPLKQDGNPYRGYYWDTFHGAIDEEGSLNN